MSASPLENALVKAVEEFHHIRYVTAAVYVCLLLEHLYSLPQEVEYIWNAPMNFAGVLFLIFRYSTLAGMTLLTHTAAGLAGDLSDHFCKHAIGALSALSVLAIAVADIIVLLRVSVLWGRQRVILALMFLAFFITYCTVVICVIIGATQLVQNTIFVGLVGACVPLIKPYSILGVWIPGVAFDCLVLLLTTWNACAKPRNGEIALARTLHRDGIAFFVILAGLRLLNLFLTLFAKSFLIGVCISWPVAAMTLSRFIFHVREAEGRPHNDPDTNNYPEHQLNTDTESRAPRSLEAARTLRHSDHSDKPSSHLNMWEVIETRSAESHQDHYGSSSATWIERHSVCSASIRSSSSVNKI